MIINHEKKIAVSFAPKTGSTSVRAACLANGWVEVGGHHSMFFGAIPPDYVCAMTVRDPFARAVSLYWHKLWEFSTLISMNPKRPVLPCELEKSISMFKFLRWSTGDGATDFYRFHQSRWYMGSRQHPKTELIRLESINKDCRRILGIEVDHLNKTNHRPVREYFDDWSCVEIVKSQASPDFASFGYSIPTIQEDIAL